MTFGQLARATQNVECTPRARAGGDCGKTLIKSLSVQFHLGEITPPDSAAGRLGNAAEFGNAVGAATVGFKGATHWRL